MYTGRNQNYEISSSQIHCSAIRVYLDMAQFLELEVTKCSADPENPPVFASVQEELPSLNEALLILTQIRQLLGIVRDVVFIDLASISFDGNNGPAVAQVDEVSHFVLDENRTRCGTPVVTQGEVFLEHSVQFLAGPNGGFPEGEVGSARSEGLADEVREVSAYQFGIVGRWEVVAIYNADEIKHPARRWLFELNAGCLIHHGLLDTSRVGHAHRQSLVFK